MEKRVWQPYLDTFRFDAIVQQGKKVGKGLIGSVGKGSKAELLLGSLLLRGLIDKVPHILFEQTYDMARKRDRLRHAAIIELLYGRSKIGNAC